MMQKELFTRFIKDRFHIIFLYLASISSIVTFFHLSEPVNTEVFYPMSIGVFLLVVCLTIDWLRYYPTNRAIAAKLMNQDAELQPHTEEQKVFQQLVNKMTSEYTRKNNELKEQNKERLYFLSHWMHHLKTPVSVMELIITKEEKSNESADSFEKIKNENNRLHTFIQQGLTMLRMESFENDLEIRSVDLLPSLRKLINDRKKECIYQSIYPSIVMDGENAFIVTDPKWNEILLEQIISNAIKYSGPLDGSKKLIFTIERNGQHISLTIKDEGVGIPAYDLERVFQPFFTGENGRKFSNSTGIGLYLSKKIADKLGATIHIQSEPAKGTVVTIQWLAGTDITGF
ncbi:Signal transduction histidine kinase [Mesobacillus persicus]|uniref:histidine kinase n=1 Tax=Mesobacillus persicus TaxID=930146 RepID=A0A1H8D4H5_9BACI|nr:sensor histidine kinase [Mesobacillus persicus]SEN01498.1 Signal transduction histidine kinase [Mesobacillus persicus]